VIGKNGQPSTIPSLILIGYGEISYHSLFSIDVAKIGGGYTVTFTIKQKQLDIGQ
jgi:hypothetical protein